MDELEMRNFPLSHQLINELVYYLTYEYEKIQPDENNSLEIDYFCFIMLFILNRDL